MTIVSKPIPFTVDGKQVHPLVLLAEKHTLVELGKILGHRNHTTVAIYVGRARKRPTTTIPAEWVLTIAKLLGVRPARLRPDLYHHSWKLPEEKAA